MSGSGVPLLGFFTSVARQLPEIAVIAIGLVVVLGRKATHPKASNLAAAGLAILLGTGIAGAAFFSLAPAFASRSAGLGTLFAVAGFGFSALRAGGLGLLVAAVVADRGAR